MSFRGCSGAVCATLAAFSLMEADADAFEVIPAKKWASSNFCNPLTPIRWPLEGAHVSVNTAAFSASGTVHPKIEYAIEQWDNQTIPGSNFGISHSDVWTIGASSLSDNTNLITTADLGPCGIGDLAATNWRRSGPIAGCQWKIQESDTLYNPNCSFEAGNFYDFNGPAASQDNYVAQIVAIHEAGHMVGLDHVEIWEESDEWVNPVSGITYYVNYNGTPNGLNVWYDGGAVFDVGYRTRKYLVNEDDREGVRWLYPDSSSTGRDVGVQSYYVPQEDSEFPVYQYCAHDQGGRARPSPRRDLLARAIAAGGPAGTCPADMSTYQQPVLQLERGASLEVNFTYSNLGTTSESVRYAYYLNTTAVPGGTQLYSHVPGQGPNKPYQVTKTLQIPSNQAYGTYYLVVKADSEDVINNEPEDNNVAFYNRKIQIVAAL